MPSRHSTRVKIGAAWAAILVVGLCAGWLSHRSRERNLVLRLFRATAQAALAFDREELRQLRGEPADAGTPAYAPLKVRLQRIRNIDASVRRVGLVRISPDPARAIWLADSSPVGTASEARPGGEYTPPGASSAIAKLLRGAPAVIEGPFPEAAGDVVVSYALVEESIAGGGLPGVIEVLLIEREAGSWRDELLGSTVRGAAIAWSLLALPFIAWLAMRRQLEQRAAIRNLSEAMEQSRSAIMIVDLEGRIEYANRGVSQQLGYSRRELIGRLWSDLYRPRSASESIGDLVAAVQAGRLWEGEWLNRRKDGTGYPARGVVTPVRGRAGAIACYVAVFDDISESRRREAELREARDRAQAGDRAKGQFLATMSHEVRTPLNGIVGFTSLLLETPLSAEQREYVQTIKMSTEALIQLTGDILDFARIESGKLNLDPLACDPRECIEDALDLLAAKAGEKRLELLHRVADDVPAAVVTDGGRVRQVLVNLVGNAVKFTEHGEIVVTLSLLPPAEGAPAPGAPCRLLFTVRDTGIGIPAEHQAKLFRPFTQVDESTTRRYGGTGLGLAISRNLVEMLGGTIRVESEPGRGSTFSFTIAAAIAAPPPVRDLKGLRLGLGMPPGALRRELGVLASAWHAVVLEADTPEALAAVDFHLAVVDIDETSARALQASAKPQLPHDRTVAIVPLALSNELRAALRSHFRLLINKPVHHSAFFALLSGSRRPGPSQPPAAPLTQFGLRVLIVEDNPVNRRLVERAVQSLGCTSTVTANGRQALDELQHRADHYDLVLLDLHMPEIDGLTALREIRAGRIGARAQTMWVIALTADAREQQRTEGMQAGLNDYLTKPLALSELEAALHRFRNERLRRR